MAQNSDPEGIAAGLKNRAQQSAAIAEMRDAETHPKVEPTKSPYAQSPTDKPPHQHPAPKGQEEMYKKAAEWAKPLGSLKHGTPRVPKTGIYKLHEGEKVVPADQNPDNENAVEQAFDGDEDKQMEHSPSEKQHFHRSMAKLHGGALHRHFNIPEDQPIPMEKKQEAANSDNPHTAAMGRMAVAMHGWKHGKK